MGGYEDSCQPLLIVMDRENKFPIMYMNQKTMMLTIKTRY